MSEEEDDALHGGETESQAGDKGSGEESCEEDAEAELSAISYLLAGIVITNNIL